MGNYSKQREQIKEAVLHSKTHPTADEVYEAVKLKNPTVSLSTVYRNLNLLSDKGVLRKIHTPNGSVRFDGNTFLHHHVYCARCGRLYDLEYPLKGLAEAVYTQTGAHVLELHLTVEGICPECQAFEQSS